MGAVKNWICENACKIEDYLKTLKPCELEWLYGEINDAVSTGSCADIDEDWWQEADTWDVAWYCAEHGANFDDANIEDILGEEWEAIDGVIYLRSSMHGGWWYQYRKNGSKICKTISDEECKNYLVFKEVKNA